MSEAALRSQIPVHFSKQSPCWPIYTELHGIHAKLKEIADAKTHSMCVRARAAQRQRIACLLCLNGAGATTETMMVDADEAPAHAQRGFGALPPGASPSRSLADLRRPSLTRGRTTQMLNAIDSRRSGGIFAGAIEHDRLPEEQQIPEGQAVCADELAAAYALLESLTDSAAPMSAPMLSLRERLEALKARLAAAMEQGLAADAPEVQAAQRELDGIDSARLAHGGVFAGDAAKGVVPAGQALLSSLLNNCYGARAMGE